MKGFLILVLFGIIIGTGIFFVHYAPVCSVEYSCPVTRDVRGNVIKADCAPQVRDYQNRYQAYFLKATVLHEGTCTNADRERKR